MYWVISLLIILTTLTASPNEAPDARRASPKSPTPNVHANLDLVFPEGSTKIVLSSQRPLIQSIVRDAIDHLRASLLFTNAFPDAVVTSSLTKRALITAAETHNPSGLVAYRLQEDEEYLTKLGALVRDPISEIA